MDVLREEIKSNHVKCFIKIREGRRKSGRDKEIKNKCSEQKTVTDVINIRSTVSIMTLGMNSTNTPIISTVIVDINKTQLDIVRVTHFKYKDSGLK